LLNKVFFFNIAYVQLRYVRQMHFDNGVYIPLPRHISLILPLLPQAVGATQFSCCHDNSNIINNSNINNNSNNNSNNKMQYCCWEFSKQHDDEIISISEHRSRIKGSMFVSTV